MKRKHCSQCHGEIDSLDFYMESKDGKICSDCLMKIEPVVAEDVHLFKRRASERRKPGTVMPMQFKEAL